MTSIFVYGIDKCQGALASQNISIKVHLVWKLCADTNTHAGSNGV